MTIWPKILLGIVSSAAVTAAAGGSYYGFSLGKTNNTFSVVAKEAGTPETFELISEYVLFNSNSQGSKLCYRQEKVSDQDEPKSKLVENCSDSWKDASPRGNNFEIWIKTEQSKQVLEYWGLSKTEKEEGNSSWKVSIGGKDEFEGSYSCEEKKLEAQKVEIKCICDKLKEKST